MTSTTRVALLGLFTLAACGSEPDPTPEETGDTGVEEEVAPQPAALAPLSSGDCPDLSSSGTRTFLSSGGERTVSVVIPSEPTEDMPVIFFFHGLVDQQPTSSIVNGLDLQATADSEKVVFIVPESRTMTYFGMTFYMWEVMEADEKDLVLFDDLRTCVAENLSVDLRRLTAMGFSGGALFTTVVTRERSDTLATSVEMSGGSDIDFAMVSDEPIARYESLANDTLSVLMFSGGNTDTWPGGGVTLVDFQLATDNLEANLTSDAHYTWRCRHDSGHTVTSAEWYLSLDWALSHSFSEPSPFADGRISEQASWCTELGG